MKCLVVNDKIIAIVNGYHIDCYNYSKHQFINVSLNCKLLENDIISDIELSPDGKHLALITSTSKQLLICDVPLSENFKFKSFPIPRNASKIRFTTNSQRILVADKSGDVLLYDITLNENFGTKLLGHLSLLLDVLQTSDGKYIITSDRDEKIRVSCYPNVYNIKTYCLGHKEFVNHLELLPHNKKYLTSSSGDGTIKCWNYAEGTICYTIDTQVDVNNIEVKENFVKTMDEDGIEVNTLPIVHYSITQLNETSSILAVAMHTFNTLLIYSLHTINNQFSHQFESQLSVEHFPAAIQFHNFSLFLYDDIDYIINVFKISHNGKKNILEFDKKIKMFENKEITIENSEVKDIENRHDYIKKLYKRKYDNVQEYHERKKQRLQKCN